MRLPAYVKYLLLVIILGISSTILLVDAQREPNPVLMMVADINPTSDSYPSYFTVYDDKLYFSAIDGTYGNELWRYDNASDTVALVADINPCGNSNPTSLIIYEGLLYFGANGGPNGTGLWRYDSISNTTALIADFDPDKNFVPWSNSPIPHSLTIYDNQLYFGVDDGIHGRELWRYDATSGVAALIADINPDGDSSPGNLTVYKEQLYFEADGGLSGDDLWRYDNNDEVVAPVIDADPNSDMIISNLIVYNDRLFFFADDGSRDEHSVPIPKLWYYDDTKSSKTLVVKFEAGGFFLNERMVIYKNHLYFRANDGLNGNELWRYDSTSGTASLVANINPGSDSSYPDNMTVFNGQLYFIANDGIHGLELWSYDNASDTAALVADIDPNGSSIPSIMSIYKGRLFFKANDGTHGDELWMYNPDSPAHGKYHYEFNPYIGAEVAFITLVLLINIIVDIRKRTAVKH